MDSIVEGINNLLAWFSDLPQWVFDLIKNAFLTLFDLLYDFVCHVFEKLFIAINAVLSLIEIPSNIFNANTYIAGAPAEFLQMMVAIRVPEGLAIIVAALGIRFLLGLIPIVRVGG